VRWLGNAVVNSSICKVFGQWAREEMLSRHPIIPIENAANSVNESSFKPLSPVKGLGIDRLSQEF